MKHEELRRLNPLVAVLADWEDANGTMACILPNEWSDLRQAVMDACVDQSPRMLLNALREYAESLDREPKPVASGRWDGAEYWMPLAWELCAEECGEDSCNELLWTGGPIKEPWGDRWLQYEDEAKRLIALVHKHAPANPPNPESAIKQRLTTEPPKMTEAEIDAITDAQWWTEVNKPIYAAHRAYARAICEARDKQWRGYV